MTDTAFPMTLDQLMRDARQLLALLEEEQKLLKQPRESRPEDFESMAERKLPLLERIARFEQLPETASEAERIALSELLEACQTKNRLNGMSLHFLLTNTNRTLQILHGQDPDMLETRTYSNKGKKSPYANASEAANRRNISKA